MAGMRTQVNGHPDKDIDYLERCLQIAKEMEDREEEARAYSNLGNALYSLGNFKKAKDYHERCLEIVREIGNRAGEGLACGNLGKVYRMLGDLKNALNYHELNLKIAIEIGDRLVEGAAYNDLGNTHRSLGHFKNAIDCFERFLKISKEIGHKTGEGMAYGNLGTAHHHLGNFKRAIDFYERDLKIAREVGDRIGEGVTYGNLGNVHISMGDFKTAIHYHERYLEIVKEVGDRAAEGNTYGNLGNAHHGLGDFKTSIDYHERHIEIAKEIGDRAGEGGAYGNLGTAYDGLGDFKKAIEYYGRHVKIAKEIGNRAAEGRAFCNLGNAYQSLGDIKKAIDYHERDLEIAKEIGDRAGEGTAYCNLGNGHCSLADFKTAIAYYGDCLRITKEVGDRTGEGRAYGNLGNAYHSLKDFKTAIYYRELYLKVAKEIGGRADEGRAFGNLGNTHYSLGDFEKAIEYHEQCLKIVREIGDREQEGHTYGNLGVAYNGLKNFSKAIDYHERGLKIAKEIGARGVEGCSYGNLGISHENLGDFEKALDNYQRSVTTYNDIRDKLQFNDEWKISLRNMHDTVYCRLWRLLLKQGKVVEALVSAEQGRAQALKDLMELKYVFQRARTGSETVKISKCDIFSCLPLHTVFIGIGETEIVFWVSKEGEKVKLRRKQIGDKDVVTYFQSLILTACQEMNVRYNVRCEDRSLETEKDTKLADERSSKSRSDSSHFQTNALQTLYDAIFSPIADLLYGNEVIVVPEGPLCLAPYAALMDSNSRYVCETFKIRVLPSLTSLKLITDCAEDCHSKTGALLVGDPWVQEVTYKGKRLHQLPCAKEEVQIIGQILQTDPLIGRQASKDEVLKRLSSVALVHIAAHGTMETGEIALAPNPAPPFQTPVEDDFVLTMKDVLNVHMRARLVVLSCCHSAGGKIKAEGVVGIARAFLGAGARSVLVSLWAIDDKATLEFMKIFYQHLVRGRSASEALNQTMNSMRESEKFSEEKYWAPFVLMGDDVTLEFPHKTK